MDAGENLEHLFFYIVQETVQHNVHQALWTNAASNTIHVHLGLSIF